MRTNSIIQMLIITCAEMFWLLISKTKTEDKKTYALITKLFFIIKDILICYNTDSKLLNILLILTLNFLIVYMFRYIMSLLNAFSK